VKRFGESLSQKVMFSPSSMFTLDRRPITARLATGGRGRCRSPAAETAARLLQGARRQTGKVTDWTLICTVHCNAVDSHRATRSSLSVAVGRCFICLVRRTSPLFLVSSSSTQSGRIMLLNREEMSRENYVVPSIVLQRLLEAATAAHYSTVRTSSFTFSIHHSGSKLFLCLAYSGDAVSVFLLSPEVQTVSRMVKRIK